MRSEEQGAYGKQHVRRFLPLIRHFQHVLLVQKRLVDAETRSVLSAAALNMIDMGVVFLDASRRVVFMNKKAERIAGTNDGFFIDKNSTCCAAAPVDDAKLKVQVRTATEAGLNARFSPCDAIRLRRPSGRRPINVLIVSVMPRNFQEVAGNVGAVLFLNDTTTDVGVLEDLLLKLYDLTPAEIRLARALLNGSSIAEYCENVGISDNTARTQLKQVLYKCEAKGQSDLLRVLLRSPELVYTLPTPEV